jgi:hypothetical protein
LRWPDCWLEPRSIIFAKPLPPAQELVQFNIPMPEPNSYLRSMAMSPDGLSIAFTTINSGGGEDLWLRELSSTKPRKVPGAEGGRYPFWSPDSRNLGFFAQGELWKWSLASGTPVPLCEAQAGGGTWNQDNVIVFGSFSSRLSRASASGGTPTEIAGSSPVSAFPQFLPDGKALQYLALSGLSTGIHTLDLAAGQAKPLMPSSGSAYYTAGHLLFERAGTLMAQAFDTDKRQLSGEAFQIDERGGMFLTYRFISGSGTGALAHARGAIEDSKSMLSWHDRKTGKPAGNPIAVSRFSSGVLSPDLRRLAFTAGLMGSRAIWILDLERKVQSKLTAFPANPGNNAYPVWSSADSLVTGKLPRRANGRSQATAASCRHGAPMGVSCSLSRRTAS